MSDSPTWIQEMLAHLKMNSLQITKESRKLNAALYALNADEDIDE